MGSGNTRNSEIFVKITIPNKPRLHIPQSLYFGETVNRQPKQSQTNGKNAIHRQSKYYGVNDITSQGSPILDRISFPQQVPCELVLTALLYDGAPRPKYLKIRGDKFLQLIDA